MSVVYVYKKTFHPVERQIVGNISGQDCALILALCLLHICVKSNVFDDFYNSDVRKIVVDDRYMTHGPISRLTSLACFHNKVF